MPRPGLRALTSDANAYWTPLFQNPSHGGRNSKVGGGFNPADVRQPPEDLDQLVQELQKKKKSVCLKLMMGPFPHNAAVCMSTMR